MHRRFKRSNMLASEKGSTMLITLLVVTLFIIMGVVLLGVVSQGMKSSAAGEARIIAESLAQKGLDEATVALREAIASANRTETDYRRRTELLEQQMLGESGMNSLLSTLEGTYPGASPRESYEIRIVSDPVADLKSSPVGRVNVDPDYPYVRKVTVYSTGKVAMMPAVRVAKSRVMYVNSINQVMRYAVSASIEDQEGSPPALTMNGAVYTIGDIFVQGDWQMRDQAAFLKEPGQTGQVATALPALRGFYNATGRLINSSGQRFDAQSLPIRDTLLEQAERVEVDRTVGNIMSRYTSACALCLTIPEPMEWPEWILADAEQEGWKHYDQVWAQVSGESLIRPPTGGRPADILLTDSLLSMEHGSELTVQGGSLIVDYQDPDLVVADLQGTVRLDEGQVLAINGNTVIGDGFRLEGGQLFVRGDLKVYGAVKLFGTVYVDGNVELRDISSMNTGCSEPSEGTCRPLIVAASGSIEIGEYIHDDADTEIAAYLYANGAIKLYGVYSRLRLVGGIHADQGLELNAVLGELSLLPGAAESDPVWERYAIRAQTGLAPEASRLRITHDINLYESPPAGIPLAGEFNLYISRTAYESGQEAL